jgi:hypothetical protein
MKRNDNDLRIDAAVKLFLARHPSFAANPLGDWSELVGPQVARYSRPHSLKRKVLVIHAYDAIWKHHLDLNKEVLLAKINHKRAEPLVEKIRVLVGEVEENEPVLNPNYKLLNEIKAKNVRGKKSKKPPLRRLTQEEKNLLTGLSDPDLRAMGKKLLQRLPLDEDEN